VADFFEQSIKNYSGLSTETKPTIAALDTVPNGSRWREVDTENVWFFNLSDDTWYLSGPRIDQSTHSIQTIEYAHHEIHSGSSFTTHFDNTTTSDDDHRSVIGLQTPANTKWPHLIIAFSASSPAEFFMIEAPTIDLGAGTEIVTYNRNRNSGTASTVLDLANPQVAGNVTTYTEAQIAAATFSGGTTLAHYLLVGGEGPKAAGGAGRGSQEWMLDQGAKYTFVMQNIGANANLHEIHLDWYEHINKL
jgi:hypothetical protein